MIGHELTHGFDDQGRKLDAEGKLRDWWTPADVDRVRGSRQAPGRAILSVSAVSRVHINGELTMGENIADLGGLNIALRPITDPCMVSQRR